MKINDIVTLIKAGYTKEDIRELVSMDTVAVTPPTEEAPVSDPSPEAAPAAAPATIREQPAPVQDNSEILAAIKDLTKVIQAQNVRSDALHPTQPDSAVDILGSIINNQKGV